MWCVSYCFLVYTFVFVFFVYFFFFKQKTAYEMRISDWSSDVCSSDLAAPGRAPARVGNGEPPSAARGSFGTLVRQLLAAMGRSQTAGTHVRVSARPQSASPRPRLHRL